MDTGQWYQRPLGDERVVARRREGLRTRAVKFSYGYYTENVIHNGLSYGQLGQKGYSLMRKNRRRVVPIHDGRHVAFDVELQIRVVVVPGTVERKADT
ncbi:hypothetical protein PF006_g2924 [Phytophthora fragariae]|uniref:Uncharacterized protein n=1 Tax=Phytophthora fragariae TaxID=53985 RepID=A0A6A3URF6_9STRA|nr:hypothetical protein PF006_g2924 [Phytophthora fragariae]